MESFAALYGKAGLAPFMALRNATVFLDRGVACYDFECFLDEYLGDYGFSLVVREGEVEFVILDRSMDLVGECMDG